MRVVLTAALALVACPGCVMLGPGDRVAWSDRVLLVLEPALPHGQEEQLEGVGSFRLTVLGEDWHEQLSPAWSGPGHPVSVEITTPDEPVRLLLEGFTGHSHEPAFQLLRGSSVAFVLEGGGRLETPVFLAVVGGLIPMDAPASFGAAVVGDGQGAFYVFGGTPAGLSDDDQAIARDQVMRFAPGDAVAEPALQAVGSLWAAGDDSGIVAEGGLMNTSATWLLRGGFDLGDQVLVAGGWEAFGRTDSLSGDLLLFDPVSGGTREVGSLVEPRAGHGAFELDSGLVVFAGGYARGDDGELGCARTVEVFDPEAEAIVGVSDDLEHCLLDGAGVSLGDEVLWCGGVRWDQEGFGAEAGCWLVDAEAGVTPAPWPLDPGPGLLLPAMVSLGPSRALLVGGAPISGSLPVLATGDEDWGWASDGAWLYDHRYGMWKATRAPMHQPRAGHGAVALPNRRVLVAGGAAGLTNLGTNVRDPSACAEVFDLDSNSWELLQPCSGDQGALPAAIHRPSTAVDPVYGALILGGLDYRQAAPDMALYAHRE